MQCPMSASQSMHHGGDLHTISPVINAYAILLSTRLIPLARVPITAPFLLMDGIIDKRCADSRSSDEECGVSLHLKVYSEKW